LTNARKHLPEASSAQPLVALCLIRQWSSFGRLRSVIVQAGTARSCAIEPLSVHAIVWPNMQIS
jgi:hypothetical protein